MTVDLGTVMKMENLFQSYNLLHASLAEDLQVRATHAPSLPYPYIPRDRLSPQTLKP